MEMCQSDKVDSGLTPEENYHFYHRYDPNMCSAARFSPPYTNPDSHTAYENVILVPNHETGTIQNIDANAIITDPDSTQPYPNDYHGRPNIIEHNQVVFDEHHRVHLVQPDFQAPPVPEEQHYGSEIATEVSSSANMQRGTTQILLHRSPNGHLYQNFYVNEVPGGSALVELVKIENGHNIYPTQYVDEKESHVLPPPAEYNFHTKIQHNGELVENLPDTSFVHLEPSIIANQTQEEFLHSSYNVINNHGHNETAMHNKEQQRILLESTMSPLLAAVNDITQRDAELQSYLNQNIDRESNLELFTNIAANCKPNESDVCSSNVEPIKQEYVDISDVRGVSKDDLRQQIVPAMTDDCLLVSDRPVETRARASLPTNYLYLGKSVAVSEEPSVFAKKPIPVRTKFGPFEGEVRSTCEAVLDVLRIQTPRTYPLLLLDQTNILEVTNENTSNWMRFVRMAHKYSEQNLFLFEEDGKLFFKCCQPIKRKEELKVGYSKEYADYHGLKALEATDIENRELFQKQNPWPCFECDQRFPTSSLMQEHLSIHDIEDEQTNKIKKRKVRRRKNPVKTREQHKNSNRCLYCPKFFMTNVSLKKHMAAHQAERRSEKFLSKNASHSDNALLRHTSGYKKFNSEEKLKNNRLAHIKNELKPYQCTHCPQRCLTPAALKAHIKSHTCRHFSCVYCSENFKHIPEFKSHVSIHATNGIFTCQYCKKKYREYHLVRKHIKIFHPAIKYPCNECGRPFPNMHFLRRHKLIHADKAEFLCSQCGKQFKRKDKLREHFQRIHTGSKIAKISKKKIPNSTKPTSTNCQYLDVDSSKVDNNQIKVAPAQSQADEYKKFFFKCDECMLGFKRRGMLVNHMAKRHPDICLDSIPELNVPILKPQSLFYCQYCTKVYQSSTKRKAHVIKNHPGLELPPSGRGNPEFSQMFSQTVGNLKIEPHRCQWCYKQYASRNRLLIHYRKAHENNQEGVNDEKPNFVYENPMVQTYKRPNSPENKLLKLSSAALELSSIEDRKFFDFLNERSTISLHDDHSSMKNNDSHVNIVSPEETRNGFSKVDVNFKVVESEFSETSSNGELNRLPQLFEESMACL